MIIEEAQGIIELLIGGANGCALSHPADKKFAFVADALRLALKALRAQQEQEKNPPISLDELKRISVSEEDTAMWIYDLNDGSTVRGIIDYIDGQGIVGIWCEGRSKWYRHWNYGKKWLAYRYKPNREAPHD